VDLEPSLDECLRVIEAGLADLAERVTRLEPAPGGILALRRRS
jgi:hypothetical protein